MSGAESDRRLVRRGARRRATSSCSRTRPTTPTSGETPALAGRGFRARRRRASSSGSVVFPPFARAGRRRAPALGHNLFVLDPDGPLRHTVPFVQDRRARRAVARPRGGAARRGHRAGDVRLDGDRLRDRRSRRCRCRWRTAEDRGRRRASISGALINFRGPALLGRPEEPHLSEPIRSSICCSSADRSRRRKPAIDPAVFRDKIVFVGATAAGLFDVFETPFAQRQDARHQIHAAVADDILSNRFMRAGGATASASRSVIGVALVDRRRRDAAAGVVGDRRRPSLLVAVLAWAATRAVRRAATG